MHHRHAFEIHLYAEIAARHHDAVGHAQNRIQILDGFRLFQFGDDRRVLPSAADGRLRLQDVFSAAHKAHRDVIRAMRQGKGQVRTVLRRDRRYAETHARQVDAFVLTQFAAIHHFADHFAPAHAFNAQLDQSIGKQDAVAFVHFSRQRRESCAHAR